MAKQYSLAYLTVSGCSPSEMIYIAARTGYDFVGLRLIPMGIPGEIPFRPDDKEQITRIGAAFKEEIPGVENFTRVRQIGFPVLRYNDKVFSEEKWFLADSSYFKVFGLDLIKGDSKTALTEPNTVVITESTAKRYFGDDEPMGKVLNSDNRRDYVVTGVLADPPQNTHL